MTGAAGRRVVLLHGLWMPGASMHWLSVQLRAQGFDPRIFSYHSVSDGPGQAASRLADLLLAEGEADIVAHSLGGLIALRALREQPRLPVARGSVDDIAGICSEDRNVVGLMPHPERAISDLLGSADGVPLLRSLLASAAAAA